MNDQQLLDFVGKQLNVVSKHISSNLITKISDLVTTAVPSRFEEAINKLGSNDRFKMKRSRKLFSIYRSRQFDEQGTSCEEKYFTSMHYYKRDLTPVKEIFATCNEKTPYKSNFQDYEGSLISKGFKNDLLSSLGENVKCIT